MAESIALRHGQVFPVPGGRVAVAFLSNPAADGEPVHAELSIKPRGGPEQTVVVRVGDHFTIGSAGWVLERVDNAGTYEYEVHIRPLAE